LEVVELLHLLLLLSLRYRNLKHGFRRLAVLYFEFMVAFHNYWCFYIILLYCEAVAVFENFFGIGFGARDA
jgi:hypothetical protein